MKMLKHLFMEVLRTLFKMFQNYHPGGFILFTTHPHGLFFILGLKLEAIEGVFFNKKMLTVFIKENECGLDIKIF